LCSSALWLCLLPKYLSTKRMQRRAIISLVLAASLFVSPSSCSDSSREPFTPEQVGDYLENLAKGSPPPDAAPEGELQSPVFAETFGELEGTKAVPCDCKGQAKAAEAASLLQLQKISPFFLQKGGLSRRSSTQDCGDCSGSWPESKEESKEAATGAAGAVWLNQCELKKGDIEMWGLERTQYRLGGISLPETIAYTDSCDMCKYNDLKCSEEEVELDTGYCLCMWRVDGADPVTKPVACGRCVQDCVGNYLNIDLGKEFEPAQQKGICLRRASSFSA